jgi:PBSX family phage terminase large subunit
MAEDDVAAAAPKFVLKDFCFLEQLAFIENTTRFKTAVCSRRAGKTIGIAADMISTCTNEPNVICLYLTLTFKNARSILWPDLKKILQDFKIECRIDDQRLEIKFPNRSEIRLGGAKDEAEIEKYRGWKLRKVYLDEMQSFRPYVKYFINDILLPALRDLRGSLLITGTPGPIPAGPFYEYATSPNLAHHTWTAFDNPHMHNPPTKDLNVTLAEERLMKGIDENDPGYIRETYGKWVEDLDSLVFKFSKDRNNTTYLPNDLTYIMGIDIGYEDADAIAILGFDYKHDTVYLVEEVIKNKQTISDLVKQIQILNAKTQALWAKKSKRKLSSVTLFRLKQLINIESLSLLSC